MYLHNKKIQAVRAGLITMAVLAVSLLSASNSFAQPAPPPPPSSSTKKDFGLSNVAGQVGLSQQAPEVLIGRIIQTLLGFVGLIAFILVIYAGFLWMTAGGNEDKVKKAKEILRNAVIGMVIVFSAYAITEFVLRQITEGTGVGKEGVGGTTKQ